MSTDPLFMKQAGQYYWYHNDHLGTPQMMTTSSGALVWKAKYTAFGKVEVDPVSTVVNPLRFPGQYEDAETGLHYNWWRYYSPDIGRYLTPDPIGLFGGLNRYVYSYNNSINLFDSLGLYINWRREFPIINAITCDPSISSVLSKLAGAPPKEIIDLMLNEMVTDIGEPILKGEITNAIIHALVHKFMPKLIGSGWHLLYEIAHAIHVTHEIGTNLERDEKHDFSTNPFYNNKKKHDVSPLIILN